MNETINDDIKDLEENIAVHKLAISSCKWIRSSMLTDVNLDSLSYHLSVSAFATVYVPNEEEYKTIISSGQIEVKILSRLFTINTNSTLFLEQLKNHSLHFLGI